MNTTAVNVNDSSSIASSSSILSARFIHNKTMSVNANKDESSSTSLSTRLISGSIGSIVTALTITPLDVVKVRQQIASTTNATTTTTTTTNAAATADAVLNATNTFLKNGGSKKTPCPSCGTIVYINNGLMECAICPTSIRPFAAAAVATANTTTTTATAVTSNSQINRGISATMRRIFVKEGFSGIYAGLGPTLVMSIPNTVLYFATYDEISWYLKQKQQQQQDSGMIPLIAGSGARLLASGITAPFELIRTRQAMASSSSVQQNNTNTMWHHEMYRLVRNDGIKSLYKGLAPTLWRDVPFSAIYWFHLEYFKHNLWNNNNSDEMMLKNNKESEAKIKFVQSFVNGALSGMIAAACTTPFDVVKTRRQQQQNNVKINTLSKISNSNNNTWSMMQHIIKTEGIEGLWRGNTTRMLKVAPACAIMISCYELGKLLLQ